MHKALVMPVKSSKATEVAEASENGVMLDCSFVKGVGTKGTESVLKLPAGIE